MCVCTHPISTRAKSLDRTPKVNVPHSGQSSIIAQCCANRGWRTVRFSIGLLTLCVRRTLYISDINIYTVAIDGICPLETKTVVYSSDRHLLASIDCGREL